MTLDEHMARLEKANPRLFAATEIKLKPSVLREQLRLAYDAGAAHVAGSALFEKLFPKLPKKT